MISAWLVKARMSCHACRCAAFSAYSRHATPQSKPVNCCCSVMAETAHACQPPDAGCGATASSHAMTARGKARAEIPLPPLRLIGLLMPNARTPRTQTHTHTVSAQPCPERASEITAYPMGSNSSRTGNGSKSTRITFQCRLSMFQKNTSGTGWPLAGS